MIIILMSRRKELKKAFDDQIERMLIVINQQFDRMQKKHPRTQIVEFLHHLKTNGIGPDIIIVVFSLIWWSWMFSLC